MASTSTTARAPDPAPAATAPPAAPAPDAIARRLALGQILADVNERLGRLLDHAPIAPGGGLVLDAQACRCLDDTLGLGATLSPDALIKAVDRLGSMRIGDIRIPFTPGQLAELQHRASKRGRTVEAEMRAVVARIEEEIFYKAG